MTTENWRYPGLTNIPRLEIDGTNWAIFSICFCQAMQATGRWEPFDSSKPPPVVKDIANPTTDEVEAVAAWEREDQVARYLLSQRLPDLTVLGLSACPTVYTSWQMVSEEYLAKSEYARNDLEQVFLDMRCPRGGDIRPFLMSLCSKREELAAAGISITQKDYQCTVLKGIPEELAKFAAQLLSSACLNSRPPVATDTLIDHICEEAEHVKNRRGGGAQSQKGGSAKKEGDEALAATRSLDRKGRKKGKCHNCGKPGHWANECCSPKKETSATETSTPASTHTTPKAENKPVGSANAVTRYDLEGDGFWMAMEPEYQARLDVADLNPLLQEGEEREVEEMEMPEEWCREEGEVAAAIITAAEVTEGAHVELYDTGATRHISPFRSDFKTYAPLTPPVLLNTANQQRFQVIGTGSMAIQIPNGDAELEVLLWGVLYVASVAYTLVSLGSLDDQGYVMSVGGGKLDITDPYGQRVSQIARTSRGLYRITHEEEANAVELLSIMELHRWMGHIAPSAAQKLVNSGAITGVNIDPKSKESHCDVCLYVRTTRQPIPSVRIRPPAENFGDEIHSNVWGPSRTATRQGRHYFITFTDDATRYTVCFLLRTKDGAFEAYKLFEAWALTQDHCKGIKVLRSDHGGEYLSGAFNAHLAVAGMARKLTTHDTPQLNGIAERLNQTLLERIWAFAHESGLPQFLWGESLRHASWLKNRTATRALDGKTPFEALYGQPPDLQSLRIWGCQVWVHSPGGSKLDPCAKEARWLGVDVDVRAPHILACLRKGQRRA